MKLSTETRKQLCSLWKIDPWFANLVTNEWLGDTVGELPMATIRRNAGIDPVNHVLSRLPRTQTRLGLAVHSHIFKMLVHENKHERS